jgi:hypothetical protein
LWTTSASGALLLTLLLRLLLLWRRTLSVALTLLWSVAALRHFAPGAACLASALLELAELLLHETARLLILARADVVMPAIRAAFPSLGIGFLAAGAEDGFRERHRRIGAHCTLRPVDETRRKTLLTLIDLATENSPNACWDDRRAAELLRREATREELRELGVDERLLDFVYAEDHA